MNQHLIAGEIEGEGFKFSREKQGYSPEEVDTVIDSLLRQNAVLTQENERLAQGLDVCNAKIQQLSQGAQVMEQERQRESLRIADIMTSAGRTAEETVAEARHRAAEIVAEANLAAGHVRKRAESDVECAQKELFFLIDIIKTARESSDRHYKKLEELLRGAGDVLDTVQPVQSAVQSVTQTEMPVPEQFSEPVGTVGAVGAVAPIEPVAPVWTASVQPMYSRGGEPIPAVSAAEVDPYDDFLRTIRSPETSGSGGATGKIIGHFGS